MTLILPDIEIVIKMWTVAKKKFFNTLNKEMKQIFTFKMFWYCFYP